jgi:hypothetical protein
VDRCRDTLDQLGTKSGPVEGVSEAVRKPFHTVALRSRSLRAVMKRRAIRGRESVQHQMDVTDFDHSRTGFWRALIVLAVPAIPPMPGVCAFNHPVWLQRYEATRARRTHLHFDAPARTMLGHPGVQRMVVILLIRKDRDETWIGPGWVAYLGAADNISRPLPSHLSDVNQLITCSRRALSRPHPTRLALCSAEIDLPLY